MYNSLFKKAGKDYMALKNLIEEETVMIEDIRNHLRKPDDMKRKDEVQWRYPRGVVPQGGGRQSLRSRAYGSVN
jgi:hypothetical protein